MHKWSANEILCSSEIFIKYFSDEVSGVIISITFLNVRIENAGISYSLILSDLSLVLFT